MGEIHQLYPDPQNSLDKGIFFEFEIYYRKHQEEIFHTLIKDRQMTIVTDTGKEILCTLQKFYTENFVKNPYGREYHILLDSGDRRFGCHIEHRLRPVTGELWATWLYPSSWMINNRKTWRSSASLYPQQEGTQNTEQEETEDGEQDVFLLRLSPA